MHSYHQQTISNLLFQINAATPCSTHIISQQLQFSETMDSLIKLTRFSSAGQGNTEELYSSKDQRIPPQRSLSFKTEKKRAQNWFRRQFSRNMSRDYDSEYQMEHATAVAATAYAIKSLQDSSMPDQKKTTGAPESPLTRLRSRKEDVPPIHMPDSSGVYNRFSISGENARSSLSADSKMPVSAAMDEKKTSPPTIKKRLTFAEDDEHLNSLDTTRSKRTPEPSASSIKKTPTFVADERLNSPPADTPKSTRAPSMKKTPTLTDELKNSTSGGTPSGVVQKTDPPPTKLGRAASKPDVPPPAPPAETRRHSSTRTGVNQTPADVWEKAELEKIKERHEKLIATILSWESKKKKKARSRLDKVESESEQKRVKALQKFRSDMETIDQIVGGARAQAEERRKNKELKAKAKADTIRTTGKVPPTCFCC